LCAAIEQSMSLQQAMRAVRNILVRPNALKMVEASGLSAEVMVPVGPALGLPCSEAAVLHVNEAEWEIAAGAEALVITSKAHRALASSPIHIPSIVELLTDYRCSCMHGHTAFRLR
jgi:hypothetical protein